MSKKNLKRALSTKVKNYIKLEHSVKWHRKSIASGGLFNAISRNSST